jgi:hypothetical protein
MNKYTQEFWNNQFPGHIIRKSYDETMSNFWSSNNIPIVDLGFEFDLTETISWLKEKEHLFGPMYTQVNEYKKQVTNNFQWFSAQRTQGWRALEILGQDPEHAKLVEDDNNNTIYRKQYIPEQYPDELMELREQMSSVGINLTRLKISALEPGGYIQPHVDRKTNQKITMDHIWMPLHEYNTSLKIYPYGELKHKTGHAYLMNNADFVHSAYNPTNKMRYALLAKIDYKNLSDQLWQRICNNVKQQWFDSV